MSAIARPFVLAALSALMAAAPLQAQSSPLDWLAEINRDIWIPFLRGVSTYDETLYLGVRSKDYIRLQADARMFLNYPEYVDDTVRMMGRYKEQGTRITLDMRFTERIANGQSASERGVMKVVFAAKGAPERVSYGPFHSISRKEHASWKVLVDYFAADAAGLDQAAFDRAHAMDALEPFRCYMPYPDKKLRCN